MSCLCNFEDMDLPMQRNTAAPQATAWSPHLYNMESAWVFEVVYIDWPKITNSPEMLKNHWENMHFRLGQKKLTSGNLMVRRKPLQNHRETVVSGHCDPGREMRPRVHQGDHPWRPTGKRWFSLCFLKVASVTPMRTPLGPRWRLQNLMVSC